MMKQVCPLAPWIAACLAAGAAAPAQESLTGSRPATSPGSRPAGGPGAGWSVLRNGMSWRCLTIPGSGHLGMFLWFRIGGDHDPAGRTGMAHLMEHLLATSATASTPVRTYEQLAKARRLGVNAVTRNPCTLVWSIRPVAEAEEDLSWFAGILSTIRIGEEDLARERLTMLSEVERMTRHVPGGILQWRGRAALFPGDARGRQVIGEPEQVASIALAEVIERRQRFYTPRNAMLLLVGGLTEAEAAPLVTRLFAGLDGGPEGPPQPPAEVTFAPPPMSEDYERVGAPFVTAAFAAPPVDHADSPAFLVAAAVLSARATSTFLREDREGAASFRGRGREAEAFFPPVLYPFLEAPEALFVNCRGTDGGPATAPREEIVAWLGELATHPPDAASLRMARLGFESQARSWPVSPRIRLQAEVTPQVLYPIGLAAGMHEFLGVPADYARRFDAVTAADVTRVAQTWLAPAAAKWVALLPKHKR